MSFLYPSFLFALSAVAIPVIIHLFSFRKYKRILFTNVRFLQEVKIRAQSETRLQHLLILVARILTLAFLVMAFAQPYIPYNGAKKENNALRTVSVYVDNSFSMDAVNDNGQLFEQAKKYAYEITNAFQPSDRFQLITNDADGPYRRLVSRDEFRELLNDVDISPSVKTLPQIFARKKEVITDEPDASVNFFLISDFQKNICDFENLTPDTSGIINIIHLPTSGQNNLYIDSCWFSNPYRQINQPEVLTVRIVNKSDQRYENIPLKLVINGQQKALSSFSIDQGSSADTALYFTVTTTGMQYAYVALTDHPITFDDKFYLSFDVAEQIPVLCINQNDSGNYIRLLFGKDPFIRLTQVVFSKMDYSLLGSNSLVVLAGLENVSSGLAQELKKYTANGGSLMIFPSPQSNTESYFGLLSLLSAGSIGASDTAFTKVSRILAEHPLFENVFDLSTYGQLPEGRQKMAPGTDKSLLGQVENFDLPVVYKHYDISILKSGNSEVLMEMQNGKPFLVKYFSGAGPVYVCAVPLDITFSNFTHHAMFVPVLYKMALQSRPSGQLYYLIGQEESVDLPEYPGQETNDPAQGRTGNNLYRIISENKKTEFIPEHRTVGTRTSLFFHDQVKKAGNYSIVKGDKVLAGAAFNFDRRESDITAWSADEVIDRLHIAGIPGAQAIKGRAESVATELATISEGTKLWKWCVVLALFFLACEIALLRLWRSGTSKIS